jgi:chromosome segregation ATPase
LRLTAPSAGGYPRFAFRLRGWAIPERAQPAASAAPTAEPPDDQRRLADAVEALVARFHALRAENARLRRELAEGEERLRELHQRRQDVLKLVDDLIARIDEVDERFEAST